MRLVMAQSTADASGRLLKRNTTWVAVWLLLAFVMLPSTALAQLQVDRLYPPVVQIGSETTIRAEGKFPNWPTQVICDRDDVKIAVGKDSGHFTVRIPADAPPGVTWVRVLDEVSASKLVPLLIESTAGKAEVEPNDKINEATAIPLPAIAHGKLAKSGDVDTYRIQLKQGQTFVASVLAHRPLRSPMDAVLQLTDARGNVIFQTDDERGLDPQLVYDADKDQDLFVRIFAFPEVPNSTIGYAGAESFIYAIRMTTDAYVDHVLPLVASRNDSELGAIPYGWNLPPKPDALRRGETKHSTVVSYLPSVLGWQWQTVAEQETTTIHEAANDSIAVARSLPCIFSGHITKPGEIDRLRIPVSASTRYQAIVYSRAYGFPLDSVLRVINAADGSEVATNDDVHGGRFDASVMFTPQADDEYLLEVSDLVDASGARHAYSVFIAEAKPTAELTVAEDHFTISAGSSVEVPITIVRLHGLEQSLTITAQGLPDGVVAEPVMSAGTGDTSKSVKLKLAADKAVAFQGHFQIVATANSPENVPPSVENGELSFTAKYPLDEVNATENLWLTVVAVKPD